MAVIDAEAVRAAIGADTTQAARVASIHAAALARVNRVTGGAPDQVKSEAIILYAGYLWQASAQSRNVFPDDQGGRLINISAAWRNSGAHGLVSSWRVPRAAPSIPRD